MALEFVSYRSVRLSWQQWADGRLSRSLNGLRLSAVGPMTRPPRTRFCPPDATIVHGMCAIASQGVRSEVNGVSLRELVLRSLLD
jgi:hypothetical protein